MKEMKKISGKRVDLVLKSINEVEIVIENGKIQSITECENATEQYLIPGFVDAHIHIESSMMPPTEFARHAMAHGTVACVCDPHEIANVCGVAGIDYMINDAKNSPLKFYFGAPSCVPATAFDAAGAVLDAEIVTELLKRDDIHFLAEVMDYVAVTNANADMMQKIAAAHAHAKVIDGHAPNISNNVLAKYVENGISTDHECMNLQEALEKIALGMKILIREGSAAKNFDDLVDLLGMHPSHVMFCSDDKHPDDLLLNGHIDTLARRAIAAGFDIFDVLRACSMNPIQHYKLNVGMLQVGDAADFLIVDNLQDLKIEATYIGGEECYNAKLPKTKWQKPNLINNFEANAINVSQIAVPHIDNCNIKVIDITDGQLYTKSSTAKPLVQNGEIVSDIENDVLKIVQYNRYTRNAKPSVAFVRNFGLKQGALASSIAHDSHNIIAIGTSDAEIAAAINIIVGAKGGVVATKKGHGELLALPIAGLMSDLPGEEVAVQYQKVDALAKTMGCQLHAPFMTMAFMSLVVIPELKLGDKGLFDGLKFEYISLQTDDEVK